MAAVRYPVGRESVGKNEQQKELRRAILETITLYNNLAIGFSILPMIGIERYARRATIA
jgi:hypothetical protein